MAIRLVYAPSPELLAETSRGASAKRTKRENVVDSLRRLQQASQFAADQQLRREGMRQSAAENEQERLFRLAALTGQAGIENFQAQRDFKNRQTLQTASDQAALERLRESAGLDSGNAELRADLEQRNWGLQHAPKIPGEPEAGGPPLTPAQRQDARLMAGIQNNEPWAIDRGLQTGVLKFSRTDKERAEQLQQGIAQVARDPRLTPRERAAEQARLAQELAAIRPTLTPPDERPPKFVEQLTQGSVKLDPRTGKYYEMDDTTAPPEAVIIAPDAKGTPKVLYDPRGTAAKTKSGEPDPLKQRETFQKRYDEAFKALTKEKDVGGTTQMVPPTPEEIEAHLKAQDALFEKLNPRPATAPGGTPGGASGPINPFGPQPAAGGATAPEPVNQGAAANTPAAAAKPDPFARKPAPDTQTYGTVRYNGKESPVVRVPGVPFEAYGVKNDDGSYSVLGDSGKGDNSLIETMRIPKEAAEKGGQNVLIKPKSSQAAPHATETVKFEGVDLPVTKKIPLQDGGTLSLVTAKVNGADVTATPIDGTLMIVSQAPDGQVRTLAKLMSPKGGTYEDPIFAPDPSTWDELSRQLPKGAWITDGVKRYKNE